MHAFKQFLVIVSLIAIACSCFLLQDGQISPGNRPGRGQEITYEVMFREIAAEYNLDWRVLAMQAYRESRFDPQALGADNDMGLMQILPSTWNEWAPRVGVSDPFDPYSNVLVGAAYSAYLRDHFRQQGYPDQHWVLISYNWGINNVHQLLTQGGGWTEVPEAPRRYALDILQAGPNVSITWAEVQAQLTVRRTIRR